VGAVGLANNHLMDAGATGLADTTDACAAAGLMVFGAGTSLARAREPLFARVGTARVALLAFAEHEFGIAGNDRPGVAPLGDAGCLEAVAAARADADVVVVLVHGGTEHYPLPSPGLRDTCLQLARAGADLVVCQHSHVAGAVEIANGSCLVYGMGNFVFPYPGEDSTEWNAGYCLSLSVCPEGLAAVRLLPHRYDASAGVVRLLADEEREAFRRALLALNARAGSAGTLASEWSALAEARRRDYLAELLGLTRPERLLAKRGVWPWWRLPRRRLPVVLNLVRCESHREALVEILTREVDRDG
jgi:poly-gamma-glutamate synthesis protein (capsule biosynthesis protein)